MFVDKNAVLSWEWARIIVRTRCDRGVPRFQNRFDARTAFVNDRRVVKINDMVMRRSMISNSEAFGRCTFLMCSFFLVANDLPVSPIYFHEQLPQGIL